MHCRDVDIHSGCERDHRRWPAESWPAGRTFSRRTTCHRSSRSRSSTPWAVMPTTRNRPRRPATCTQASTRIPAPVGVPFAEGAAPTPRASACGEGLPAGLASLPTTVLVGSVPRAARSAQILVASGTTALGFYRKTLLRAACSRVLLSRLRRPVCTWGQLRENRAQVGGTRELEQHDRHARHLAGPC